MMSPLAQLQIKEIVSTLGYELQDLTQDTGWEDLPYNFANGDKTLEDPVYSRMPNVRKDVKTMKKWCK